MPVMNQFVILTEAKSCRLDNGYYKVAVYISYMDDRGRVFAHRPLSDVYVVSADHCHDAEHAFVLCRVWHDDFNRLCNLAYDEATARELTDDAEEFSWLLSRKA